MEAKDIIRLREEQEKAVKSTEEQIGVWEKFRCDYVSLQTRLRTLPDKVTHKVMVPFGSKAFMPGKLVHTNEVLVLLGDNWFVDKSAKQACEIIDRRLVGINKQLEELEKQKQLLKPRVDFTSELQNISQNQQDMVDISEEYDPVKEKKWREQHRKNVLDHRKQLKMSSKIEKETEEKETESPLTDQELWARLDELEKLETSRGEMKRTEPPPEPTDSSKRTVRFFDEKEESEESIISSDEEDDTGEITSQRPKSIRFTHTKTQVESVETKSSSSENTGETTVEIMSPADIYKLFTTSPTKPKSILKAGAESTVIGKMTTKSESEKPSESLHLKEPHEAFSGSVIERETTIAGGAMVAPGSVPSVEPSAQLPKKRVSKFKADRQKQQNQGGVR